MSKSVTARATALASFRRSFDSLAEPSAGGLGAEPPSRAPMLLGVLLDELEEGEHAVPRTALGEDVVRLDRHRGPGGGDVDPGRLADELAEEERRRDGAAPAI